MKIGRRLFEGLASIRLAVVTMTGLAVVCGAATVYEARFGTPAAQRVFYRSWWFSLMLVVLAANVLFSMLKRWPWKTQHAGFVLAHVGILLLLLGSLVSIRFGIDGTLTLMEGESSAAVALPTRTLAVALPSGESAAVPMAHAGEFWGEERHALTNELALVLTRYQPHVTYHEGLADAPSGVPALEYHLEGEGFGREQGWLLADDPEHGSAEFGPVQLSFVRETSDHPATALLASAAGQPRGVFVSEPGGRIRYALSSRRAGSVTGVVTVGTKVTTPWMELKLVVDRVRPSARLERHLAAQRPPEKESQRLPAVEVRLERVRRAGTPEWIAWGETRELADGAGGTADVSFGDAAVTLPFRVSLLDFQSQKYPGTTMAATYESRLRIDDPGQGSFERVVSMNRPLHHRGYILFQSSYMEGERMTSVLALSRAPGLPLVYGGTGLLVLGVAWMFYVKPWLAKRQGLRALREQLAAAGIPGSLGRVVTAFVIAASWAAPVAAADRWSELRRIPVQDGGRVKPLDTFARETARRLTGARVFGAESVNGLDPVEWLVAAWAQPERWREQPLVRVSDASLRELVELPAQRDRFSFAELAGHEPFLRVAEQARQQSEADPDVRLLPAQQAALRLYDDLSLMGAVLAGDAPRVMAGGPGDSWRSFHALEQAGDAESSQLRTPYQALLSAYRTGDRRALANAGAELARVLERSQSIDASGARALAREVQYNGVKPFRLALCLYLAALLVLLASFPLRSRALTALGLAAMLAGFLLQSYGLLLRTLIAGRAPVTNMYESIVFAAWGAVAFGLAFASRNRASRLFAICAAAVAVPFLLIAEGVPIFDAAIDPLAPVLRDNFWLTTHVLTITLGYAALFLALALGHVSLALLWSRSPESRVRTVSHFLYRVMQAGMLLLAAGTLLGGVWASYSWGRFWGWDPKETWALIALLVYLAILHARFAGWLRDLGLAVGSIVGGLAVLMAWYGVNYVLGTGLHSYGFGSGGANAWVFGYACAEAALVAATLWRFAPSHDSTAAAGSRVPKALPTH